MPKRIQRKRTKGWRTPVDAIYVGRPTVFGNPFIECTGRDGSTSIAVLDGNVCVLHIKKPCGSVADYYRDFVLGRLPSIRGIRGLTDQARNIRRKLVELKGWDLVCWCKPGEACHADVLLELANSQEAQSHAC
jgi:hypothetical protein